MIDAKVNLKEEVLSVQSLLYENLLKKTGINKVQPRQRPPGILAKIADLPLHKIESCFGNFGIQLRKLVEYFNLDHPCLQPVVGLFEHTTVSDKMEDILSLYELANIFNAPNIISLVNRSVNETRVAVEVDSLLDEHFPVRAIVDPKVRNEFRKGSKLARNAGSVYFSEFETDAEGWSKHPSSLRYYIRLNDEPTGDTERYKRIVHRFHELGMENQANTLLAHLNLALKKRETYCGFQCVDVDALIAVMGKVHGFTNHGKSVSLSVDNNPVMVKFLLQSLCLSPKILKEIMEWVDEKWIVDDPTTLLEALDCTGNYGDWEDVVRFISRKGPFFTYRARAYMASNPIVSRLLSVDTTGILDQLDRFHDYGYLPIFDHFLLLVPSVGVTDYFYNERHMGFFIFDGKTIRSFDRREDASVFLDFLMIKHRMVFPVLIGQKDDQQYPIGYCI